MNRRIEDGDPDSDIWIVGEAPGQDEVHSRLPFTGTSGQELTRMLSEAGIARQRCYLTNVCHERPPGNDIKLFYYNKTEAKKLGSPSHLGRYPKAPLLAGASDLLRRVQERQPRLVIAFGDTSLWALTGRTGITKWRGSVLEVEDTITKVVPTFHPAAVLRMWDWRHIAIQDLRRAAEESKFEGIRKDPWRFIIRPSFRDAQRFLMDLLVNPRPYSCDGEMYGGHISCLGFATSKLDAICIPFTDHSRPDNAYWCLEEERAIVCLIRQVLEGVKHATFQNCAWDTQYIAADWGYKAHVEHDTMVMQHVAFPGMGGVSKLSQTTGATTGSAPGGKIKAKSLDFMASLYCENYRYWKDDGKLWNPKTHTQEELWSYNCEDCVRTFEVRETLESILHQRGLWEQYRFQMERVWPMAFDMMLRGVRHNKKAALKLSNELKLRRRNLEDWFIAVLGHPLNPASNPQMKNLFYGDFRCPPQYNRQTKALTLNEEALERLMKKQPLLAPLIRKIADWRSTGVFKSTFVDARSGPDGRMRCSINLTGAETFRFSTSEDPFGLGMNMQNLPLDRPSKHKINEATWDLPNIRQLFQPDDGWTMFEADLSGADAQFVAWESGDETMKAIFREGRSLWTEGARELYGPQFTHTDRQKIKQSGHATDYGATAQTVAQYIGSTVHEAELWQRRWFGLFPGVKRWQDATLYKLMTTREVQNAFGYKRYYFGRIESLLPEALAWLCQSGVALTINHGLCNLNEHFSPTDLQLLMQVHDSGLGQFRTELTASILPEIHRRLLVTVPFDDPLIIPIDIKVSNDNWGDMEAAVYDKAA